MQFIHHFINNDNDEQINQLLVSCANLIKKKYSNNKYAFFHLIETNSQREKETKQIPIHEFMIKLTQYNTTNERNKFKIKNAKLIFIITCMLLEKEIYNKFINKFNNNPIQLNSFLNNASYHIKQLINKEFNLETTVYNIKYDAILNS